MAFISCTPKAPVSHVVTGKVMDATMNNITLISDAGDTLNISTMDADPAKVPGVMINDSVRITYKNEKIEGSEILKAEALEITAHSPYFYIHGTWLQPNPINSSESQGVTLNEDGTAVSVGMATLLFKKWELLDNKLMLSSESIGNRQTLIGVDTLQIVKLDADSLVLSSGGNIVWALARKK